MDKCEEKLSTDCSAEFIYHDIAGSDSSAEGNSAIAQEPSIVSDITSRHSFSRRDLEKCADGGLFGAANVQLPSSPLLMLDRIVDIQLQGGDFQRGYAIAELDITTDNWFFKHHFRGDPIMPGCFLIEALWQLTGFFLAWSGHKGKGRVLNSGKTRFVAPVDNNNQILQISVHIRKVLSGSNSVCIADGRIQNKAGLKCNSTGIKVALLG